MEKRTNCVAAQTPLNALCTCVAYFIDLFFAVQFHTQEVPLQLGTWTLLYPMTATLMSTLPTRPRRDVHRPNEDSSRGPKSCGTRLLPDCLSCTEEERVLALLTVQECGFEARVIGRPDGVLVLSSTVKPHKLSGVLAP